MTGAFSSQSIVHLSQTEWLLQRPETFLGPMQPTEVWLPVPEEDASNTIRWTPVVVCPGLLCLTNELFTNALDNCYRDDTQTYIKVTWKDGTLTTSNDGSTLPLHVDEASGLHAPTLAFGVPQSGSNFDTKETGKKENGYTAGRNGFGSKGCNVYSTSFKVRVANATEQKVFSQQWKHNMSVAETPKIKEETLKANETRIEWRPDFGRLGCEDGAAPPFFLEVCRTFSLYATLCAPPHVRVKFNNKTMKTETPQQVCKSLGGLGPFATDTVMVDDKAVLQVCVASRNDDAVVPPGTGLTLSFVNSTLCCEGSHAKYIFDKIGDIVVARAKAKRGTHDDVQCPPSFIRQRAVVVAVLLVDDPNFTSQTKHCLDTRVKDYGWRWEPSSSFQTAVGNSALVEAAITAARERSDADARKRTKVTTRHPSIAKYDPATTKLYHDATLLVTEGDSAKNFATAGVTVVGRQQYGIYPIRGKFLNVRGMTPKSILENKEAGELLKILGIQFGTVYDAVSVKKLPYARLMVLSDQDVDGSHIAGLLFNLIDSISPSLFVANPSFVWRFATSLIRVTLPHTKEEVGFYSQVEYDTWVTQREAGGLATGVAKYYKGLGTSSGSQAKNYFRDLSANCIVLRHTGAECSEALDLFFNKKRSDDRKSRILASTDDLYVDYSQTSTTLTNFVFRELLPQYAKASLIRAIPSVVDGFKESLRKTFFGFRDLPVGTELSVANAAGKIASRTNYHHRGTAMEDTIVGMAADYTGTSNVNLLVPLGQFGTRHRHAAASAAYPRTRLNAPLHEHLFPKADDTVLEYVVDEGERVEPVVYVPIIATALCFGTKGIATGWSTDVPQYDPCCVLDATLALIAGREPEDLVPWYRGFRGTVKPGETDGTYSVLGLCEWRGSDLHVLEVPPHRETDAYKEQWIQAGRTVTVGNDHSDLRVHLVLKDCKAMDDPVKELGLEKKVTTHNMHFLDATGRLKKYECVRDVLVDHYTERRNCYERRLDAQIRTCELELAACENKAAFIDAWVGGHFDMRLYEDDDEAGAKCDALDLARDAKGSFDYLLSLPVKSLTQTRAAALRAAAATKRSQLDVLKRTTPEEVWKRELEALRPVLMSQSESQ